MCAAVDRSRSQLNVVDSVALRVKQALRRCPWELGDDVDPRYVTHAAVCGDRRGCRRTRLLRHALCFDASHFARGRRKGSDWGFPGELL